jgi:NADPH:quinone reductase-like Zn-dependent oxidoreductase
MTFEEAAAVSVGGTEALHYLRKADIQRGDQVLIVGAGGTIGTFAVQLAKCYGAEVVAVDSTGKLDMLRSIGAEQVVDYTREDFTHRGETYDVIFDVVGVSPYGPCVRLLKRGGRYLLANPALSQRLRAVWTSLVTSKKVVTGLTTEKVADLLFLADLIERGELKSVIDRTFCLEQAVDAHRYVESGHKLGNVALSVVA